MSVESLTFLNLFFLIIGLLLQTTLFIGWLYKIYNCCNNICPVDSRKTRTLSVSQNHTKTTSNNQTTSNAQIGVESMNTEISQSINIQQKTNKNKNKNKTLILATICLIVGTFYSYWLSIFYLIWRYSKFNPQNIAPLAAFLIFLQRFLLFFYYLQRLQGSFHGTIYEISEMKYKCLKYSMTILYIISLFLYEFILVGYYVLHIFNDFNITIYGVLPLFLVEWIYGITVTILFIIRLRMVLKGTKMINLNKNNEISIIQKYNELIIKLTILTIVAISTSIIFIILWSMLLDWHTFPVTDIFINSLCLVLSVSQFENWYFVLCKPCRKVICCKAKNIDG